MSGGELDEDLARALALSMQEVTEADLAAPRQQGERTGGGTAVSAAGTSHGSRKRCHDGSETGGDTNPKTPRSSEDRDVAGSSSVGTATATSAAPAAGHGTLPAAQPAGPTTSVAAGAAGGDQQSDEALLEQARALSLQMQTAGGQAGGGGGSGGGSTAASQAAPAPAVGAQPGGSSTAPPAAAAGSRSPQPEGAAGGQATQSAAQTAAQEALTSMGLDAATAAQTIANAPAGNLAHLMGFLNAPPDVADGEAANQPSGGAGQAANQAQPGMQQAAAPTIDDLLAAQQAGGAAAIQQLGLDAETAAAMAAAMEADFPDAFVQGGMADEEYTDENEGPPYVEEVDPAPAGRAAAAAAAAAPPALPPPPAWLDSMRHWLPTTPSRPPAPVELPAGSADAVQAALMAAMGLAVRLLPPGGAAPAAGAKDPLAIALPLASAEAGGFSISSAAMDAAVKARVANFRLRRERQTELVALAAMQSRAAAQAATVGDRAHAAACIAALEALQAATARRVLTNLAADDPEDLYFKEGERTTELIAEMAAERIRQPFLALLLAHSTREHEPMWEQLLRSAFRQLADLDFVRAETLDGVLFVLDLLTRAPHLQRALASMLLREAEAAAAQNGHTLEQKSFLAPLLQVGSVPDAKSVLQGRLASPAKAYFEALRGYPGNRGEADGAIAFVRRTLERVQAAAKEVAMRVIKAKETAVPKAGQEAVLAWLAAVASVNLVRVSGGEGRGVIGREPLLSGSSDRFALGAASVGLQLCRPFLAGDAKHTRYLEPDYFVANAHRLYTANEVGKLAAAPGAASTAAGGSAAASADASSAQSPADASADASPAASPTAGAAAAAAAAGPPKPTAADAEDAAEDMGAEEPPPPAASFYGRPYLSPDRGDKQQSPDGGDGAPLPPPPHFIAECFFITGQLMSTGVIPAANRYLQLMDAVRRGERGRDVDSEGGAHGMGRLAWLLYDTSAAQLLDPGFASDAVQLAVLQIRWLAGLIRRPDAQAALSLVPDAIPKDAATWLAFCVQCGRADLVSASDIGGLVDGITAVLECRHIASPLVADKMVALLTAMLKADHRRSGPSASAASSRALRLAVLGTGAAQQHLLPALMRVYALADAVVGLDVDRDNFDKFSMRHHIDELLLDIWRDPAQKKALTRLAAEAAAGAARSPAAGDPAAAAAAVSSPDDLPAAGGGALLVDYARAMLNSLMYMLGDSLERFYDVHNIERERADRKAWKALPEAERETKLRFRESQRGLGGSYMRTAVTTLQLLLELVSDEQVAVTFLSPQLVGLAAFSSLHFLELLVGPKAAGLAIQDPEKLGFDPVKLSVAISEFMLHLARKPAFVRAVAEEPDYNEAVLQEFHDKVSAGALGAHGHAVGLEQLMRQVDHIRGQEAAAAAAGGSADSGAMSGLDPAQLAFEQPEPDNLDEAYKAALGPLARGDFDSTAPRAYSSLYAQLADTNPGDTAGKMRKLGKELKQLAGRTQLPLHAAASIFLRYDAERIDKMRAIISGPEDTPYEGGLFVFDLFFPAQYPNLPPSMKLETTGQGKARFNPNLYADGKVCLSLLGTFSSADASERWNPATSSLFQVLLSIQGMILIGDPYFNEPSVEQMRATAQGAATSAEYNFGVQLNTLRWAMIDQLRSPPPGFEEVVTSHFRLLRHRIMRTAAGWLEAAEALPAIDDVSVSRMRATILELHALLAAL